jgi:glycosyltransferase involved in cell wall biosynthesis
LFFFLVRRDIKLRFQQTVIGFLWVVLQPLIQMMIFNVILGILINIPTAGIPYPIFFLSVFVARQFFLQVVNNSAFSYVGNISLIVKSCFPRLALRLSTIASALVDLEKELQQSCGSHPNITFAGRVIGEEKARLLSSVSAVVIPSSWAKPSGIVVLEAYAYDKPVIASRTGGLPELVQEGKTVWLVEPANPDALARAIEAVAQNPGPLRQMSAACFNAAQAYTIEKMVDQFDNIYLDLRTKS